MSRSDGYGAGSAQRESLVSSVWGVSTSAGVQAAVANMTELWRGSEMATVVGGVWFENGDGVEKLGNVVMSAEVVGDLERVLV